MELGEKCDRREMPEAECDAVYDYLTAMTMTIFLKGCGYCSFLVITGTARQVWFNTDVADKGYIPLNVSFLDWYERADPMQPVSQVASSK